MHKTILVTGGAGYIGSHTVVRLLNASMHVVILDNLSNSNRIVIDRIEMITGKRPDFIEGDVRDQNALQKIFKTYSINAVIHFAGLKAVGESEIDPLKYYDNNVVGSVSLFQAMSACGVQTIIFSSSATVYGDPGFEQYSEDTPVNPVNVYGHTKLMVENILHSLKKSDPKWRVAVLRYFNPAGAHQSGLIGEDPTGVPNNLMPFIAQVAMKRRNNLFIFGNDYPTSDGTGRRDYIHVEDLASGHFAALEVLQKMESQNEIITVNLGTGRPYSVLKIVKTFEKVSGQQIPYQFSERRCGDLASFYADPSLAKTILNWQAQHDIERMCQDTWLWQSNNPKGFQ